MSGMADVEKRLCDLLPVDRVLVVPGNADEDGQVLFDVGRVCAGNLRSVLQMGNTLAVTGGRTIAAVARYLQSRTEANVLQLSVSYKLMVFDNEVYSAIVGIADVLNRQLEKRRPTGLHTEEYMIRPVNSPYWKKLYGIEK